MTTGFAGDIIRALTVVGALNFYQGVARAQAQAPVQIAEVEKRFAAADKDGDGKLTLDEAKAGMPRVYKNFSKIDKGSKGFVTLEDIKDALEHLAGR
jgi:Ca2+-binding EF-hand superfamily protein